MSLPAARAILIVKLGSLGDVLLATAVLPALRATWPGAAISWAVETGAAPLLIGNPELAEILILDRGAIERALPWHPLCALRLWRDFRRQVRAREYDVVIDLHGLARSWLVALAARRAKGGLRIGKGRFPFVDIKSPHRRDFLRHAVPSYFEPLELLGLACPEESAMQPSFHYEGRGEDAARVECRAALPPEWIKDGETRPWVVLHAFTTWPTKHWPDAHWRQLANRIAAAGYGLVLTGGPADVARAAALLVTLPQDAAVSVAGRLSCAGLAALCRGAAGVVSVDSFPMHLAATVGARVVSIHGPTDSRRTGPWGRAARAVAAPGPVPCGKAPCRRRRCRKYGAVCMELVTPELVYEQLGLVERMSGRG